MLSAVADLLVILHLIWVLFMVGGVLATVIGVFYRRWLVYRGWRQWHLAGMLFAALLSVLGRLCPLTSLEYTLRRKVGQPSGTDEGFIIAWANRLIFPDLDRQTLAILTVAAGLIVVGIYAWLPPNRVRARLSRGKT